MALNNVGQNSLMVAVSSTNRENLDLILEFINTMPIDKQSTLYLSINQQLLKSRGIFNDVFSLVSYLPSENLNSYNRLQKVFDSMSNLSKETWEHFFTRKGWLNVTILEYFIITDNIVFTKTMLDVVLERMGPSYLYSTMNLLGI